MRILVAGATGYLGRHLVADLTSAGHEVRALARTPERLSRPGTAGAPSIPIGSCEVVTADVTDPASLHEVLDGVNAVVSSVGVTGHAGDPWAVDYRGNLALLDEARRAGVGRFCFVHVLHGEEIPTDLTRAKSAFAAVLRRSAPEHLVLNPSGYFSDLTAYLQMARRGVAAVLDGGRSRLSPIHGADLAAFIRTHLEAGTTGDLDVGGPETMTHREAAQLAFEVLGRRPWIISVPSVILRSGPSRRGQPTPWASCSTDSRRTPWPRTPGPEPCGPISWRCPTGHRTGPATPPAADPATLGAWHPPLRRPHPPHPPHRPSTSALPARMRPRP